MLNLVLVGMPGCGKSTVGKKVAKRLGFTFVDTDEEIEKQIGTSCGEYIIKHGEAEFRRVESEVVESVSKRSKCVIATGGGAVLAERNRIALKSNSRIVWLQRDTDELSTSGRPLSKSKAELERMYNIRKPIYQSVCDFALKNEKITDTVDAVCRFVLQ